MQNAARLMVCQEDENKTVYQLNKEGFREVELRDKKGATVINHLFKLFEEKGIQSDYVAPGENSQSRVVRVTDPLALEVTTCTTMNTIEVSPKDKSDGRTKQKVMSQAGVTERELAYIEYVAERVTKVIKDFIADRDSIITMEFGRIPKDDLILLTNVELDLESKRTGKIVRTISS